MKRGLAGSFRLTRTTTRKLALEGDVPDQGRIEMDDGRLSSSGPGPQSGAGRES